MKAYKDKALIASRATSASNNVFGTFYKSYIKNAHIVRAEQTTPYHTELDFEFEYKGESYRLSERVKGEYAAVGAYFIERL